MLGLELVRRHQRRALELCQDRVKVHALRLRHLVRVRGRRMGLGVGVGFGLAFELGLGLGLEPQLCHLQLLQQCCSAAFCRVPCQYHTAHFLGRRLRRRCLEVAKLD